MTNNFNFEIISPERIIFSDNTAMVTLPSYEGDMSVLKHHISIITFLRPGIIKIQQNKENFEKFFVQDGIVEFFNDKLAVLSTSVINVKNITNEFVDNLNKDTRNTLEDKSITDHDRYILNHKLNVLKEIKNLA